jgi:HD-GYP domain-containing protein (c-di-GMP phosphodiesterase class II)
MPSEPSPTDLRPGRPVSGCTYPRLKPANLLAPVIVVILTLAAIAAVWLLMERTSTSQAAQLHVSSLTASLGDLQAAPYAADPALAGSPATSASRIRVDERSISSGLTVQSQAGVPLALVNSARAGLAAMAPVVSAVYRTAEQKGGLTAAGAPRVFALERLTVGRGAVLAAALARISSADADHAHDASTQAKLGAAGALILLLIAFAYFYFRSVTAREAVEYLARERGKEARTDALTKLRNRRALTTDLADALQARSAPGELLLVTFDLDGFKQYNDTVATAHANTAYRTGGDEFCVLGLGTPAHAKQLLADTSAALRDAGEGWRIGSSYGAVWIPSEANDERQALKLADDRLYANKASRSSASRQVADALMQVVTEQDAALDEHVERVSDLAGRLALVIGQPPHEVQRIRLAAQLHDVGKTAIPAGILDKPVALDKREWDFMHRHPAIGARIVSAAPALANTAPLILASHERVDGRGYPHGLIGENIPLGSRIIAVCDAFAAMTSDRPYQPQMSINDALAELERCAGTKFDATLVEAFCSNTALREDSAAATETTRADGGDLTGALSRGPTVSARDDSDGHRSALHSSSGAP